MISRRETMTVAVVNRPGGDFHVAEREIRKPELGEVLVRIAASGVNPLDLKIRAGVAPHARHPLPNILGLDLAGTIEAVGPGVADLTEGDLVYGMVGGVGGIQGTLAQYATVDAELLAMKPVSLTMKQAAALPLIAITAWEGLVDRMRLRSSGTLLVHGGAGGVGHMAVQLGRVLGARVFATGRPEHASLISSLGAVPIDPFSLGVTDYVEHHTAGAGFDFIFDTVGDEALAASFDAVAQNGHVVSALGRGRQLLAPLSLKGATYSGLFTLYPLLSGIGRIRHGHILHRIADMVEAGQLQPRVNPREFRLENVHEAYDAVAAGTASGRIVVSID